MKHVLSALTVGLALLWSLANIVPASSQTPPPPPIDGGPGTGGPGTLPQLPGIEVGIQPYFLDCGSVAQVTVIVRTTPGTSADGIQVNLKTNVGDLGQTQGTTINGEFKTSIRAPDQRIGARGVLTASALDMEVTSDLNISCMEDPPLLRTFNTTCGERATTTFDWFPVIGAMQHWVDLSLFDNGFQDGSFLSRPAPLGGRTDRVQWPGLIPGLVHYWRVSSLGPDGWKTSATGRFVPCDAPAPLSAAYQCTDSAHAVVRFDFAPASPGGSSNWLDLSIFDNDFAPGSFLGFGSLDFRQQTLEVPGVLTNVDHWWRLNSLIAGQWNPSSTAHFRIEC